jgi:outer membrane receptor protein involved in Fe transport
VNTKVTLRCAIAAILSGSSVSLVHAAAPAADADTGSEGIQEIVVTAQRRTENMQDVPITIQALTAETLTQLNVATADDFVKYLPNVTLASNGPGQGDIFMRGLSTGGEAGTQATGANGPFPNVAIYLDEQSGQVPGRNLDIYAADLERIEVLEGPQGTLFGAGAQAGVLRYITNKPRLDVTEGNVEAGYAYTSHGDPSSNVTGVINLPLIQDTLAVRAVIYSDTRGGYINNVPGTFVRSSTDLSIHYAQYHNNVPSYTSPTAQVNNNNLVANAINPVTYQGIRVSTLFKFNEDWNALLVQSYQDMNAQGVFYDTPYSSGPAVAPNPGGPVATPLPDLSVQLYNPSYDKDRFENTALTINGHVGDLKLVYSGAYLVRNVNQVQDYTNYARGAYADYYQCIPGSGGKPSQCYSPSATWNENERDTHDSQELRLSTPDDWRIRGIGGLFWEDYKVYDVANFLYKSAPGFAPVAPPPGSTAIDPSVRNDSTAFFDDITRGYTQKAVFGSADIDIIPKTLTFTAGTRYYDFNNTEVGSTVSSFGCYVGTPTTTPCPFDPHFDINVNANNLHNTYTGFRSRANLSWKITGDALVYYTWSQGFRPGGFNRSSTTHLGGTYATPQTFAPDTLVNNELGWKTEWFGHRLQFNGAVYQENWNNVQVKFFDPQGGLGLLSFTTNGPNYRVRGVETQLVARVTQGLTVTSSAAWNSSDQTNSPYLIGINGKPITSIPNPYGPLNSPLAMSPPFQANLRARYEITFDNYQAFAQLGGVHQAHSYSATGNVSAFDQPGYTLYDASVGIGKDAWVAQFYGQNITDARYVTFITNGQFVTQDFVGRPRTMGVKFGYKF